MKLVEVAKLIENAKKSTGTYVGVRFSLKTEKAIKKFIKDNDIPSPDSIKDNGGIHCTLIYSRKVLNDFKPDKNLKCSAQFKGFKKLGDNKTCLVMELNSPRLVKRYKQIKKLGATHDWDDYIPRNP